MPIEKKKLKDPEVPLWLLDGFVGVLALMIYNFCLYLLKIFGIQGIIGQMEDTMGYFGLNTFIDLGFSVGAMSIGLIIIFIISFLLGIFIGRLVRRRKKYKPI